MITPAYLQTLFTYHAKANARILDSATGLTDAELDLAPIAAHGSIRDGMVHALSAEWLWRNRIEGISPPAMLSAAEFPSIASIRERWEQETNTLRTIIDTLQPADLERLVSFSRMGGEPQIMPLWQILVHLANHGTQHRSEIAAMLTVIGRSPGDLDFLRYFRNQFG